MEKKISYYKYLWDVIEFLYSQNKPTEFRKKYRDEIEEQILDILRKLKPDELVRVIKNNTILELINNLNKKNK